VRASSGSLFLSQGDRVYKVKDIATLQRWVVEKRVLPGDRVSHDGKTWEVVSERSDLRAFFAIIDQLKNAKRALKQKTREMTAVSDEAEVARRFAIEAAAQIPGPTPEESTVRPAPPITASQEMPDISGMSADHAADPDADLRAASQSVPEIVVAPESVPHLESVPAAAGGEAEAQFFSASSGSLPVADAPSPDVSFFDVHGTPAPDEESPSLNRMHEMTASQAVREDSAPAEPLSGAENPSPNLMATRPVPVQNPTPAPREVDVSSIAFTPTGPTRAVGSSAPGQGPAPDRDFDPNQTFDDLVPVSAGSGAGFLTGLLVVTTLAVGAMWYFLMGPGATRVFDTGVEPVGGDAVVDTAPDSPTPEEPTSGPAGAEGTQAPEPESGLEPEAEPEPEARPEPTTPPRARVTEPVTPKPEPRTPTPRAKRPAPAERRTPAPRADHLADAHKARGRGNFRQAAESYGKVLEANPSNFGAALQLGWMNVELGRNSAAVTAFKKALVLKGSSAEARYGLGLAYQASGKKSSAVLEYQRALDLDPDGRDAREIRAILSQLQ
jgi:Tfp pilus assembly protein PilF